MSNAKSEQLTTPSVAQTLTLYDYLKTNLYLAFSKTLMVPLTQPIQVLMRHQQKRLVGSDSTVVSAGQAYKEVRNNQSLSSLFRGAGPGVVKEGYKNLVYKGVLITGAPGLAKHLLPDSLANNTSASVYHMVSSISAGLIAGVSDAVLGGPLEALATFRATSQGKDAKASFFEEVKQGQGIANKVVKTYKGFAATTLKGSVAFSTFFAVKSPIENWTRSFYGLSPMDKAPWYSLGTSAILCGISVAITSSPFDIIKTQVQMPGGKDIGAYRALKANYKMHGIAGVTAGLPLKSLMVTLGWMLNHLATQGALAHRNTPPTQPKPLTIAEESRCENVNYRSFPLPAHN